MKVVVIDYGMGNLASICSALEVIGVSSKIISSPEGLESCSHIILPGVGSFARAIKNLNDGHWIDALTLKLQDTNVSLLGICLGMHLLADIGTEHGNRQGLGLIPGKVVHLNTEDQVTNKQLLIPHVGWNEVHIQNHDDPLLKNIKEATDFYFVHSYFYLPQDDHHIVGKTPYGLNFSSVIRKDNVWGVQFHPEKSGIAGFQLLRNFLGV